MRFSSRLSLNWKISGLYLVLSSLLHLMLAIYLWGLSKEVMIELAEAVPQISPAQIAHVANMLSERAAFAGLIIVACMATLSIVLTSRITRALGVLSDDAERFARGDFRRRIRQSGTVEIDRLGKGMNRMAAQLDARIRASEAHRTAREAIFASMTEGVLAVDLSGRIIHLNQRARELLDVESGDPSGRLVKDTISQAEVLGLIASVSCSDQPEQREISIESPGQVRVLDIAVSPLRSFDGSTLGAVIVLQDVTELRRLERVRKDFVSNVSHELRTPITSLKGFVETLLEGAIDDPRVARRFVEIIGRHTARLKTLIDNLLILARMENRTDDTDFEWTSIRIGDLVRSVVETCRPLAAERSLRLDVECPNDRFVRVNRPLLEQALINLIDNAIAYTDPGGRVSVLARIDESGVVFAVRDTGIGIGEEHLPRVFERFYRADRGRSRKDGGTGLGLSIAKHIVKAHGGEIDVESTVGRGSTFLVRLPAESGEPPGPLAENRLRLVS